MHKTIRVVTEDIESFSYNTAIARMMEYYNYLSKTQDPLSKIEIETFLKLLAPFTPHFTAELYDKLNLGKGTIHKSEWPKYDEKYLVQNQVTIVVQVNGKRRGQLTISNEQLTNQKLIEEKARKEIEKYVLKKTVKNVVYVPGKIINFVI